MAFSPTSTIHLCSVPFDNTYKHQVYFANETEQQEYFEHFRKATFTNYLTVRRTLPNGDLESSVKVEMNIDELYSRNVNYMCYRNANHGTKWFYAFIEKLIYVNENTTQIIFETDVYQTWCFNTTLKKSWVVREHSETDEIGDNVIPEPFSSDDYKYFDLNISNLETWGYLIATSYKPDSLVVANARRGTLQSGIYQGVYFWYTEQWTEINNLLDAFDEEREDCILSITCIPKFTFNYSEREEEIYDSDTGIFYQNITTKPATDKISIDLSAISVTHDGYSPVNNKLYTAPFYNLLVSNHAGEEAVYNVEDFNKFSKDYKVLEFNMYGDLSCSPTITLIPLAYKGRTYEFDDGISIKSFPQCAFNSDSFKLWLAKNGQGVASSIGGSVASVIAGTFLTMTGAGASVGLPMAISGATGIANSVANVSAASHEPNRTSTGNSTNNLLTAMGKNKFSFYIRTMKRDFVETLDNYFTMFGYQTNKAKIPNTHTRPAFNYVQTADVNIDGDIPIDDMLKLKAMYNNGVTFWKPNVVMYDYEVPNNV